MSGSHPDIEVQCRAGRRRRRREHRVRTPPEVMDSHTVGGNWDEAAVCCSQGGGVGATVETNAGELSLSLSLIYSTIQQ